MIVVVGLTKLGERVAANAHNAASPEYRVLAFLYAHNNQANKDSVCSAVFGGDESDCNHTLGMLKKAHLIAYEM